MGGSTVSSGGDASADPVMIVRRSAGFLELITQPDHAALSGRIIDAWRADGLPQHPARATILLATREHDNGWIEVDREPLLDPSSGGPFDFVSIPDAVKQPIWPRAADRVGRHAPLAGALIAEHALTVLARHRAEPGWLGFFDAMERERRRLLGGDVSEAFARDYRFVYLGDLASLIFCNGWTEPFEAHGYRLQLHGNRLELCPNPFDGPLEIAAPARRIPDLRYRSQEDLGAAYRAAEITTIRGVVTGSVR